MPDADWMFEVKVPEVGWRTVYVKTRPYLLEFLTAASARFEVVVFTASPSLYGNKVIDMIDPGQNLISHRLFRNDCYYHQVILTLTNSPHTCLSRVDTSRTWKFWEEISVKWPL